MLTDQPHRTPDEIILQWVAVQHRLGFKVSMAELAQFGELMTGELMTFILLKQIEQDQQLKQEIRNAV